MTLRSKRNDLLRIVLIWLSFVLASNSSLAIAESPPQGLPFSVALSAGAGYGYLENTPESHDYFADLRLALSPSGYLKLGYRSQPTSMESDPSQYLVMAGFMTTPKPGAGPTRGYFEIGAGFGHQAGGADGYLVAAQGGAWVPFSRGSNFGLDFGLFFLGDFFDSDRGTSTNIGAQLGLVLMLGPKK